MHKILLIIIFVFFFNSCEKPIDLELPNEDSKLVISSSLISNKYWDNLSQYLYVSNSINGLGTISDYQYTDSVPVINNAMLIFINLTTQIKLLSNISSILMKIVIAILTQVLFP